MIDIKGLDKVKVLQALHGASQSQGISALGGVGELSTSVAKKLFSHGTYFDYVHGRVIKCELGEDEFDGRLFDRDLGEGAAERAIASIR